MRSPHLVQWIKRASHVNTFLQPRRAPEAFHSLLELWGGFLPIVVPSKQPDKQPDKNKDTGGSYAGLGESIDRAEELRQHVGKPGLHYPPSLLDGLLKRPTLRLVEHFKAKSLSDDQWLKLRALLRESRATITAEMERRLAMATRQAANANLEKAQVALGIQQAVFDFMAAKDDNGKTTVKAMQAQLLTQGMTKREVPKHKAQCVAEIFTRFKLKAVLPSMGPAAATPAASAPAAASASASVTAPASAAASSLPDAGTLANLVQAAAKAVEAEEAADAQLTEVEKGEALAAAAKAVSGHAAAASSSASASTSAGKAVQMELELAGGAESGSEAEEDDSSDAAELPALQPIALATADDAVALLDAMAAHVRQPVSMWGCCGGAGNMGRSYYCDNCRRHFHEGCQKNQSKGREAPLCPSCHAEAVSGVGRRPTRRAAGSKRKAHDE